MPTGVVTVTSTVPVPAGLSAVIVVLLTTVTSVAARRAEVDRRGAGEAGAGDRHQSAAGRRTAGRAQPVTDGTTRLGLIVTTPVPLPVAIVAPTGLDRLTSK